MSFAEVPNVLALSGEPCSPSGQPFRGTFFLSLILHLCVLGLVIGLKQAPVIDRPLASYQVSLVSLPSLALNQAPAPAPQRVLEQAQAGRVADPLRQPDREMPPDAAASAQTRTVEAVRQPAKRQASVPAKQTAPKAAPQTVPPASQEPGDTSRRAENPLRDVLRGIELPPEAPKLGAAKPAGPATSQAAPLQSRQDVQQLLGKLAVPQAVPPPSSRPHETPPSRQALSEDVAKRLQALQQPRSESRATEAPARQANAAVKKPTVAMNVAGTVPNLYLAQVQNKISSQWSAPPVDQAGAVLQVVIRFRLDRSGSVSGVVIETSSGNEYFDDAGRRAVLKAAPLPQFPESIREPYLDTHFSFTVGEEVG